MRTVQQRLATIGLALNGAKCEVIAVGNTPAPQGEWQQTPATAATLLGVPIGTDRAARIEVVAKQCAKATTHIRILERVAESDPHVAFVLARMCGGFATLGFLMRAIGLCDPLQRYDTEARHSHERILGPMTELAWKQATLPVRMGGLGIRACAKHAEGAFFAAATTARALATALTTLPLPPDAECATARFLLSAPPTAAALLQQFAADEKPAPHIQWSLSQAIDMEDKAALLAQLQPEAVARVRCCEAQGAGLYLSMPAEVSEELWLPPGQFLCLVRLRLGLPLAVEASVCWRCNATTNDVLGRHALCCMQGKGRTLAHNEVRDILFRLSARALMNPERESMCFPNSQQRMDLVLRQGFGGVAQLIDVALTYPLRADAVATAAMAGSDAVADAYVEKKWTTYGPLIATGAQTFVPIVFDTFGGCCTSGRALLSAVATAYGQRACATAVCTSRRGCTGV